jgi:hypothetical protein
MSTLKLMGQHSISQDVATVDRGVAPEKTPHGLAAAGVIPVFPVTGFLTAVVLALATAAIVLVLVLTGRRRKGSAAEGQGGLDGDSRPGESERLLAGVGRRRPCPLCGALLASGERVYSTIRLSSTGERIMEISGCPQCRPPSSRRRTCPVCQADLGSDALLVARIFDRAREGKKPHVRVLGCSRCRTAQLR